MDLWIDYRRSSYFDTELTTVGMPQYAEFNSSTGVPIQSRVDYHARTQPLSGMLLASPPVTGFDDGKAIAEWIITGEVRIT